MLVFKTTVGVVWLLAEFRSNQGAELKFFKKINLKVEFRAPGCVTSAQGWGPPGHTSFTVWMKPMLTTRSAGLRNIELPLHS